MHTPLILTQLDVTAAMDPKTTQQLMDFITSAVTFIFSYVISIALSVILSGKCLAQVFRYTNDSGDVFLLSVPKLFSFEARQSEVQIGLGLYFSIFFLNLLFFGEFVQDRMTRIAGLSLSDKWQLLCVFSALSSSAVAFLAMFLFVLLPGALPSRVLLTKNEQAEMLSRIQSAQHAAPVNGENS